MAGFRQGRHSEDPTVYLPRGAVKQRGGRSHDPGSAVYGNGDYAQGYGRSYVSNSPNVRVVGYQDVPDESAGAYENAAPSRRRGGKTSSSSQAAAIPEGKRTSRKDRRRQRKAQRAGMVSTADQQVQRRRRGGAGRRFARFLVTLLLIVAIPVVGYCVLLDRALALDPDERAAVNQQLSPALPGQPYYALILGSDVRAESGATDANGRSDVILLLRVDPVADRVTMVTIPRDTPYRTSDGTLVKINETYNMGGAASTIQAVSEITGVKITHFAELGFSDLENIVDALGGVTVDVDTELGYKDALTGEYVTIEPGTQQLTGQQAQIFARARHEYESADAARQGNVRALVNACVDSVFDRPLYTVPKTVLDVARYVGTDMKSYNIAATALPMFIHPGKTTVYACAGPYDGDINPETGTWMCYEDPESWSALMSVVDSGADPSA